jgi:Flp pilus assembly protein CpaB
LKRPLRSGDFVTNEDLMGDKDGLGLYGMLPPGYRAVGVRVDMEAIAGGFASLPMSRVDIIATRRANDDKSSYSQILLEDVLVLAADATTHRDQEGRAMPANVVTVAVKPEDALRVRLAAQYGPLSLVLRKLNDSSKSDQDLVTAEQMKNKGHGAAEETAVAPEPKKTEPVAPPPVAEEKASGKRHVLTIHEGDSTKRTDYLLNDKGEVQVPEITASPLVPPVPTAAVPPPPAANPPAPPAPATPPTPPAPALPQ